MFRSLKVDALLLKLCLSFMKYRYLIRRPSFISLKDSIARNCVCLTALWGEEDDSDDKDEEGSAARSD